jgi:hypothetical protein
MLFSELPVGHFFLIPSKKPMQMFRKKGENSYEFVGGRHTRKVFTLKTNPEVEDYGATTGFMQFMDEVMATKKILKDLIPVPLP